MKEATGTEIRAALRRRVTLNVTRHFMAIAREYFRAPTEAEYIAQKEAYSKTIKGMASARRRRTRIAKR